MGELDHGGVRIHIRKDICMDCGNIMLAAMNVSLIRFLKLIGYFDCTFKPNNRYLR